MRPTPRLESYSSSRRGTEPQANRIKKGGALPTPILLKLNARGPEVAALQAKLGQLGFKLPKAETDEGLFGMGTQAAVLALQARYRLRPNGALDESTAAALDKAIAGAGAPHNRVAGRAFLESGLPATKLTIRPYHRAFGVDD